MISLLWLFIFPLCAISNLVFVGDAETDSGNTPATPYTGGMQIWSTYLGHHFGVDVLPSSDGGTNFAYAFATTQPKVFPVVPTLSQQVASIPVSVNRGDPAFVWGGVEDLLFQNFLPFSAETVSDNLIEVLDQLHAKNFKNLTILNVMDVGTFPQEGGGAFPSKPLLSIQSVELNTLLHQKLATLPYNVLEVDVYSLFNSILDNAALYGFTNVTDPAPSPVDFDGYLFWFPIAFVNPQTLQFHQILADYVYSIFTGANCYSTLAIYPHTQLRSQTRMIEQQLFPVQSCHQLCKIYPFISGNYTPDATPPFYDVECHRAQGGSFAIGATDRVWDPLTIGIAYGFNASSSGCHKNCDFSLNAHLISLFASFVKPCYYVDGIVNGGWLNLNRYHRTFSTGPVIHTTEGRTNGNAFSATLEGAYYLLRPSHLVQSGPFAKINYQKVIIDGFSESGALVGNLRFHDQSTENTISEFGWETRVNYDCSCFRLVANIALAAGVQWYQHGRTIYLTQTTLPRPYGGWFIPSIPTTWFGVGNIDFSFRFNNDSVFSVGYAVNAGENFMTESFITASFTIPFW